MEEKTTELEMLRQKVQDFEDLEAVRQLQYRYLNHLALAQWDDLLACFASDAVMELSDAFHDDKIVLKGMDEINERFVRLISKEHHGTDGPFVVHPIVRKEGDTIKANFMLYWLWTYQRTGQMLFWQQMIYNNDFKKENGEWKISVLRLFGRLGPPTGMEPPFPGT